MRHNRFLTRTASILMLGAGFLLITLGKYLRYQSPLFNQWTGSIQSQFDDVPGAGLFLLVPSYLTITIDLILTGIAISGMFLMWSMARRRNPLLRIVLLLTGSLLASSALAAFNSAWDSFRWSFYTLAVGQILWGSGLVCNIIAIFNSIKYSNGNR
ncbi:hypothetical protein [Phormidesmis sp. 146-33]